MTVAAASRIDTSWAEALPELDDHQVGAIRRIINLSSQGEGDWSGMMGLTVTGEDFGAFRFQLAYMAYALTLAHVHRLPAAPGLFRGPLERLIKKILSADCWMYWSYVSTGVGIFNGYLGPQPQQWNPVEKDNIMYSAYVQSMALMYHYLFRDDRYAQPGALTFELQTRFWHQGGFHFPYDEKSLNELIYWQMVETGYLGVACEPDCIFQICNQPNIIGFRLYDQIYGTNIAEEATTGYVKAWKEFGLLDKDGNFQTLVQWNKHSPLSTPSPKLNFWLMALLHSWYPEIVEKQYPIILERNLRDGPDGTKWIKPHPVPGDGPDTLLPALDMAWAACAAAEVGDEETLSALFAYADRFLNPVWEDGAYYYKRRDQNFDDDGYYVGMDAASGNAMFNLARLNVKDGLKKFYEGPWGDEHFEEPSLIGIPEGLDIRRAIFDRDRNALVLTVGKPRVAGSVRLEVSAPKRDCLPQVTVNGSGFDGAVSATEAGLTLDFDLRERSTLVLQW